MTPERIAELAMQADAYATIEYDRTWTAGLFNKDRWQSIRDMRFAQLVRNKVLEEAARKRVPQPNKPQGYYMSMSETQIAREDGFISGFKAGAKAQRDAIRSMK